MARDVFLTPDLARRLREMVATLDACPSCGHATDSNTHHAECVAPLDQISGVRNEHRR